MKILLTGMTKMQAHRPRRREYNTSIAALYHALLAAKHSVDWRALEYGERKLSGQYDLCILGLGTVSEFSCTYLYETLMATQNENVLYLVNDWKANGTIKLLQDGDLFRDFVLKNNTGKRLPIKHVKDDRRLLEKCRNEMFRHPHVVGPFFEGWGNRQIIIEGTPFEQIHEFDPSNFYLKAWEFGDTDLISVPKKKQWVYGALSDYSKWHTRLGATWPVRAFNKKTFIPEEELIKLYAHSYGILFPKYKASGSGWWRARYCHAIVCGNVIHGDMSEFLGLPVDFWRSIETIEKMTKSQLTNQALYQRECLLKRIPSWNHTVDTVNEIVQEVVR